MKLGSSRDLYPRAICVGAMRAWRTDTSQPTESGKCEEKEREEENQTASCIYNEVQNGNDENLLLEVISWSWVLVDGDLGPNEAIIYPGLALYQATAGYISAALYRTDTSNLQSNMYGCCSLAFKLMPKSMTTINCSEMQADGYGVDAQFLLPMPVDDFMQRSTDQLLNRNNFATFNFPATQEEHCKCISYCNPRENIAHGFMF